MIPYPSYVVLARTLLVSAVLVVTATSARAQSVVTGTVVDAADGTALEGVNVVATHLAPDSTRRGVATDSTGAFRLRLAEGRHRLRISFVGYASDEQTLEVEGAPLALGRLALLPMTLTLNEAVVEAVQERMRLRGDTTVYNAGAFRVNPDASTEDLIAKMPGVVVQDGTIQAEGEDVRRVLVDGEEFFGDDPSAALRNLPAEVVQDIEIYDRQSDQARLTGFDDGNEEKTINVVTRPDRRNGQFGRIFGGYGSEERYLTGGTINFFAGPRRFTLIGLANNVNQQNFGSDDLQSALGGSSGRRRGRGRGGARTYLVGEQAGVNTTRSFGLNYNDRWSQHVRVNGSYFLNTSGNDTETGLDREYFVTDGANRLYGETRDAESNDANHRFNLRLEAELSDATEVTFTPRMSVQQRSSANRLSSYSALATGTPVSQSTNASTSDHLGYTSSANLVVRHRFATRGRTLSANVDVDMDGNRGDSEQDVESLFYDASGLNVDSTSVYSRRVDNDGWSRSAATRLAYTEPLGESGLIQFSYRPSVAYSTSDQDAFRLDEATGAYTIPDSSYTSLSDQHVVTQRGGLSYRYRTEHLNASAEVDLQNERLFYEQGGARTFDVDRSYLSLLPSARLHVDLSEAANLRLSYRSNTSTPRASQLRDVIDDTNPILITTGNPDLQTSTSHRLYARFRTTRRDAGQMFFGSVNFTTTRDYVGTATVVAEGDTLRTRGVTLAPGAQLSYPTNLDGHWNVGTRFTYGRPIGFLHSNANISAGLSYSSTPSLISGVLNRAGALRTNGRLFLGSNISERLDFSLRYDMSFTTVTNSSARASDDEYLRHRAGVDIDWLPWHGLVLSSELDLSFYTGLSESVDPTRALWNMGVGYKFLKNDVAEVRLTIADLLNQNTSVDRTMTGTYVEDRQTDTLGRYVMLNLSYRLRHFGR